MRDRLRKINEWMDDHEKEVLNVALLGADIMLFVAAKRIRQQNRVIRNQNQALRSWNKFEATIVEAISSGHTLKVQMDPLTAQKILCIE